MKPVERQKMCPNCDGRIPQEAVQCPYCFAQLPSDSSKSSASITTDPLTALYPPPYAASETKVASKTTESEPTTETVAESIPFWSILMLALGSNLLTLGILQFFFSDRGVLRLEMNAHYWFLMILTAAPLIYFGLRNLGKRS
jgi:hypothetical protein